MILGLGSDLIEIARIEKAIARPRFLDRIYTDGERSRIADSVGAQTAAGLFAAKEAAAKALGTGFREFNFADVEVTWDELGKPKLTFHGSALARFEKMGATSCHLTISHDGGFALAVCVIE